MLQGIQLICFDLDDTLWPCKPTIQRAETSIYDWLKQHRPLIPQHYTNDELRTKRLSLYQRRPDLIHDLSELRRVSLRELADEFDYGYDWIEQAFQVFYQARQRVTFFDDVEKTLITLAKTYRLATVTNGNADIYTTAFGSYIDYAVTAAEVGKTKPDPAAFYHLMQQSNIEAGQILHVGDHVEHDIAGAQAAGVKSVWLNRDGLQWPESAYSPDYTISSLLELIDPS